MLQLLIIYHNLKSSQSSPLPKNTVGPTSLPQSDPTPIYDPIAYPDISLGETVRHRLYNKKLHPFEETPADPKIAVLLAGSTAWRRKSVDQSFVNVEEVWSVGQRYRRYFLPAFQRTKHQICPTGTRLELYSLFFN